MQKWIKPPSHYWLPSCSGQPPSRFSSASGKPPGFTPNSGQAYLLDAAGAAIVAFIAAQLGIAVKTQGDNFGERVKGSMGSSDAGAWLLLIDVIVFLVAGLLFVVFWVQPSLVAVPDGQPALGEAPIFVQDQAKAFVGVTLAALAALAPSASN